MSEGTAVQGAFAYSTAQEAAQPDLRVLAVSVVRHPADYPETVAMQSHCARPFRVGGHINRLLEDGSCRSTLHAAADLNAFAARLLENEGGAGAFVALRETGGIVHYVAPKAIQFAAGDAERIRIGFTGIDEASLPAELSVAVPPRLPVKGETPEFARMLGSLQASSSRLVGFIGNENGIVADAERFADGSIGRFWHRVDYKIPGVPAGEVSFGSRAQAIDALRVFRRGMADFGMLKDSGVYECLGWRRRGNAPAPANG